MPRTPETAPPTPDVDAPTRGRRMTLSDVVAALLSRGPTDHSSVTLTRNSKGDTQIEVVVRTGDSGEVVTADQAYAKAVALYNSACAAYPSASRDAGATS